MARKGLNTRKRGVVNIEELNAYKVAYGSKLGAEDYFYYVGMPAILSGFVSFLLLYYWWLSLLMALLGVLFGLRFYLPKSIKKGYTSKAFVERNKFVNNMTQVLTDKGKTVVKALESATERADGEFKKELEILHAKLIGADEGQIKVAFKTIIDKYYEDIVFVQFMEQLETFMLAGKTNLDTLKEIKSYHNVIKVKQEEYEAVKFGHLSDMKKLSLVVIGFILAITFSYGFPTYIQNFAHHPIGWVTTAIFGLLMAFHFIRFSTYLFDDSILEVKLK